MPLSGYKSILAKTAQDGNRRQSRCRGPDFSSTSNFANTINSALTASHETCKMRGASI
jgi:hypothetical protein